MSKELEKAKQQVLAGQYKKAVRTLWAVEFNAREDMGEATGLLELATALISKTEGGLRTDCEKLVGYAEKYIMGESSETKTFLGNARYLGGCPQFGSPCEGNLYLTATAIYLDSLKLDIRLIQSVELGGGQVAKSRMGATLAFGVAGLATKGSQGRTEMAVHLTSGDDAFFIIDKVSTFEFRAKLQPLLKGVGVSFADEIEATSARSAAATVSQSNSTSAPSLADELAKLAQLHASGFLSDEEVAVAKTKLLGLS